MTASPEVPALRSNVGPEQEVTDIRGGRRVRFVEEGSGDIAAHGAFDIREESLLRWQIRPVRVGPEREVEVLITREPLRRARPRRRSSDLSAMSPRTHSTESGLFPTSGFRVAGSVVRSGRTRAGRRRCS